MVLGACGADEAQPCWEVRNGCYAMDDGETVDVRCRDAECCAAVNASLSCEPDCASASANAETFCHLEPHGLDVIACRRACGALAVYDLCGTVACCEALQLACDSPGCDPAARDRAIRTCSRSPEIEVDLYVCRSYC